MKLDQLETIVRTERNRRAGTLGLDDIVTRSPAMHRLAIRRSSSCTSGISSLSAASSPLSHSRRSWVTR